MMHTLIKMVLCAAIILTPIGADAQEKEFKKLKKIEGVEHVHIPKFLINLAAKDGESLNVGDNINLGDYWTGDLIKKINAVDIFNSEEKEASAKLSTCVRNILSGNTWEQLIDVTDEDGEKIKICQAKHGKQTTFVIFAEEDSEASLVVIDGKLDMAQLMEQMSKEN